MLKEETHNSMETVLQTIQELSRTFDCKNSMDRDTKVVPNSDINFQLETIDPGSSDAENISSVKSNEDNI